MNLALVLKRLEALGKPVAYRQFKASKKNPPPSPPFFVWFKTDTARGADDKNFIIEREVSIELYTDQTPEGDTGLKALEAAVESQVLHDVTYRKYQANIDGEEMIQTAYELTIIEKGACNNGR